MPNLRTVILAALLLLSGSVAADIYETPTSGEIRFAEDAEQRKGEEISLRVESRVTVELRLGVRRDELGHEFISVMSNATNPAPTRLHYLLYLALYDEHRKVVATLHSEDAFSAGVASGSPYRFSTASYLPKGKYKAIRSYESVLYVSEKPFSKKLWQ